MLHTRKLFARKLFLPLLLAAIAALPNLSRAAIEPTYDLASLCSQSTDVVEARLTCHHQPGQGEWKDTFTATILNSLEGKYKTGDVVPISSYPLWLYVPAQTNPPCLLFLKRQNLQSPQDPSMPLVDMLLIDAHGHVRRYFQQGNPGPMVAEGYTLDNKTGQAEENDADETIYTPLADERKMILSKWAAAKKPKASSDKVLKE
jgi:hypothetical protein